MLFRELMEQTDWDAYGHCSGNQACTDCMVHSGYEPSAVEATFGSLKGFLRTVKLTLFGVGPSRIREAPTGAVKRPEPIATCPSREAIEEESPFEVELPVLS